MSGSGYSGKCPVRHVPAHSRRVARDSRGDRGGGGSAPRNCEGVEVSVRWQSDIDDETSVDDLFASGHIHLERMSNTHYWLGITIDGVTYHIDFHSKRKITAFARELPPRRTR